MFFWRVAAANVAASQAKAQMNPVAAHLEAFFAALRFRLIVCESGRDAYKYRPLFLQRITLQAEWECGLENASRQERT